MALNERTIAGKRAIPPHLLKNSYSEYNADDYIIIDSPDDSIVYKCLLSTFLLSVSNLITNNDYTTDDVAASITIPANCYIDKIIVKPDAANEVTGLQVGTTVGAEDVVSAVNISDDASLVPVFLALIKEMFSFSSSQTLWISATNWNSATLTIYVICRRIA